MADRDYYELLGVGRDADEQTLKKAFRRLARQLHPDVSTEPDAEARFREVTEAYEVLSNSETRALYDRYGHAGLRSGGFTPTNFDMGGLSDLFAAFFGDDLFGGGCAAAGASAARTSAPRSRSSSSTPRAGRRWRCRSTSPPRARAAAATASSRGRRRCAATDATARGGCSRSRAACSASSCARPRARPARGAARSSSTRARNAKARGGSVERRELDVDVPAGIHDGQRIRVSGEGHAGALGGRAGDVYVLVRVKPDPRFVREGNDIYTQVDLTIVQAALGATLPVETLDGPIELELLPGVQPGEVRVLKGKGMPVLQGFGRGDQRVLVNVSVPRHLNDEQRRLLEEFDAISDENTYRHDESFFEKLKSAFR